MKQYLLSIYQPVGEAPPPETLERVMRDVQALVEDAKAAGVLVFTGGLHPPSSATVVRIERGDAVITDGPFTEGKEQVGGLLIVGAPDLDSALGWARRLARAVALVDADGVASGLPIEVRPFQG